MIKVLFLASGNGGTMKFIHQASRLYNLDFEISGVISDRECGSTIYSNSQKIPTFIFNKWREQTDEIIACIKSLSSDIVVTNIFKILPPAIFECCNAKFINLHYSLLPAFGGVIGFKTLELAKGANTRIIGATCHYVSEEVDAGKVISQAAIPVDWSDDFESIGDRIFRIACESILNGLLIISNKGNTHAQLDSSVLYSPALRYDKKLLNEEFWQLIKTL